MKINKLTLLITVFSVFATAQVTETNKALVKGVGVHVNSNNINTQETKNVSKYEDFIELEKVLLDAYSKGDNSKSFALGGLYMTAYTFADGRIIQPNYKKAYFYLQKALNHGFGLAALPLMRKNQGAQNWIEDSLLLLEQGMNGKFTTKIGKTILATTYNSLVLDYRYENIRYVHKALDLTYPISQITSKSTLDFTIANLLNLAGNIQEANKYLNTACNNPEVEEVIKKSCQESLGITNNIKETKNCRTCGIIK